jgi:ABC-type histidine transport system ATPase subunit
MPRLCGGAVRCGEFGATLLFAGNLPGETQTMPLAIYITLEFDVRADLVVLEGGRIAQHGAPEQLAAAPQSAFVAELFAPPAPIGSAPIASLEKGATR